MNERIQKARLSSAIVETYYIKLRELSYQNKENTSEFDEIIDILKKATLTEKETYDELSDEEIATTIQEFKNSDVQNVTEARMYDKLNASYRKRNNTEFTISLGNIITSKIIIDVLKTVIFKIINLTSVGASEEDIELMLTYNDIYKYNYLTANEYTEQLSLQYKFDVLALPDIEFDEIEKKFKTQFVNKAADLFYNYITDSINELLEVETDDQFVNLHVTLFEMSRIEVVLPYLDKVHLTKLANYLNELKSKKDNNVMKKIRIIVNKRKEEFE